MPGDVSICCKTIASCFWLRTSGCMCRFGFAPASCTTAAFAMVVSVSPEASETRWRWKCFGVGIGVDSEDKGVSVPLTLGLAPSSVIESSTPIKKERTALGAMEKKLFVNTRSATCAESSQVVPYVIHC